jgi:glycerol-3-phosphate dehydrogenase
MDPAPQYYDLIIIGAGVVGCLIARTLARYRLSILLIDQASDVGTGASAANTGIIHSGYYPLPGTLKAALNVAGNPLWDSLSAELNFTFKRTGGYVVAVGSDELLELDALSDRARRNGVTDITRLSRQETLDRESCINPQVSGALWVPGIGTCDPFGVTLAAAENALANGVQLLLETRFESFLRAGPRVVGIQTNRGAFACGWVVNSAGTSSAEIMHSARLRPGFKITPVKGCYFVLDNSVSATQKVIFPVPLRDSKGIVVTHTAHGNILIGPDARESGSKTDTSTTAAAFEEVWKGALKLIPGLRRQDIIASYAGLRSTGNAVSQAPGAVYPHDFIIETDPERGLVNLAGIDSPGLTSAPAIALRVLEMLKEGGLRLNARKCWNPLRPARPRFREIDNAARSALIKTDPRYARVVCRCESVTEGEVVAEIHSPIPALNYDALKRRCWLGTGRCQGSFDIPRVVKLIAAETGLSVAAVTKKGRGSELVFSKTRDGQHDQV